MKSPVAPSDKGKEFGFVLSTIIDNQYMKKEIIMAFIRSEMYRC